MTAVDKTPAGHVIYPRDIAFGRGERRERWWLNGDPVATHFYNALSMTFPQGERFFMESVRHYRHAVPAELAPQVQAFLTQEAVHSREHVAFNRQVSDSGYDVTRIEQQLKVRLELTRRFPPAMRLGATIALEHFTAIMAHEGIVDPKHMQGAAPEAARLWRWHAMEEIEHKAVAYDTYMAGLKKIGPVLRWLLRVMTMFLTTLIFFGQIISNLSDFYRQDGINTPRTWWRTLKYVWVEPGIMAHATKSYLAYYKPGFHPWQQDDRELLAVVQSEFAAA